MARQKWFLRKGTAYKETESTDNGFDLLKWLERSLKILNVNHYDLCCSAAINATATATVDQINNGNITSTSAAATSITLPLPGLFNAKQGVRKTFVIDNTAGASTVTVVASTGITTASAITGGTTLTVAAGAVGTFQLYFKDATHAILSRLA